MGVDRVAQGHGRAAHVPGARAGPRRGEQPLVQRHDRLLLAGLGGPDLERHPRQRMRPILAAACRPPCGDADEASSRPHSRQRALETWRGGSVEATTLARCSHCEPDHRTCAAIDLKRLQPRASSSRSRRCHGSRHFCERSTAARAVPARARSRAEPRRRRAPGVASTSTRNSLSFVAVGGAPTCSHAMCAAPAADSLITRSACGVRRTLVLDQAPAAALRRVRVARDDPLTPPRLTAPPGAGAAPRARHRACRCPSSEALEAGDILQFCGTDAHGQARQRGQLARSWRCCRRLRHRRVLGCTLQQRLPALGVPAQGRPLRSRWS